MAVMLNSKSNNKTTTKFGKPMYKKFQLVILLLCFITTSHAVSISEYTKGMQKHSGFFDFYWDQKNGKILLKVKELDKDFLYVNYLQSGVGSNDIGLDRGQIGSQKLVKFQRFGNKVLLIQPNLDYRALSNNPLEVKAVSDGFAQSVIWGAKILAETKNSALLDATDFLLRDSHHIANRLNSMEQGNYSIDANRSVIFMDNSKSFPDNTEFEAMITFKGKNPGNHLRTVIPSSESFSVRTHHSFIRLPEEPYQIRQFDPRSGAIAMSYQDYAVPLGQSLTQQVIIRHRLEKKHPELAVSDPIKPIVYYLDPGTPEPMRSALLEGASWWAEGFLAAGFSNAFQVKLLPEGADALDVRYNTIQWVHRSTRGWSYGANISDPRTGEILKGHVSLGSLRIRQDMLIAQGLLSPFKEGINADKRIQSMALARLRQLSAHEVGHTLGFTHNFSASTIDRDSVMDYPHPLVKISSNNSLDLTDAYTVGLGEWDKIALRYSYQQFEDNENKHLNKILSDSVANGHRFISDRDARVPGGSHPSAHLWDNGSDPIQGLQDVLKVRKIALENFGLNTIKSGETLFSLEQILTPIYLFHRYQTEAVSKLIAGVDYRYALKGEKNSQNTLVDGKRQQQALVMLMKTLHADQLAVPENILQLLLPPPDGSYRHREHFKHRTGLNFDALGAAETAAQITLKFLLNPQRANRLIEQHARLKTIPSLSQVIDTLINNTWNKQWDNDYYTEVQNSINSAVLKELMKLVSNQSTSPQAKAITTEKLIQLKNSLSKHKTPIAKQAVRDIEKFIQDGDMPETTKPLSIPPGSPIGSY